MGISNALRMIQIGEITSIRTLTGVALSLNYQALEDIRMSIIIQNKIGRAVFEGTFELQANNSCLEFAIPDVTGGEYDAWIDVKGEVSIRRITIVPRPRTGLFGWIKDKLS